VERSFASVRELDHNGEFDMMVVELVYNDVLLEPYKNWGNELFFIVPDLWKGCKVMVIGDVVVAVEKGRQRWGVKEIVIMVAGIMFMCGGISQYEG